MSPVHIDELNPETRARVLKQIDETEAGTTALATVEKEFDRPAIPEFVLTSPSGESLPLCTYKADLLTPDDALAFFNELSKLPWARHAPNGNPVPRFFQWMGIPPHPESYTGGTPITGSLYGGTIKPIAWTPAALAIKKKVEEFTGEIFDSLNINFYRDHKDHLGWHADDEYEGLWTAPIASVSLGAVRKFQVRHGRDGEIHSQFVASGSLVVMPAGFQKEWLHRLAKTSTSCGPRINLTFRRMGM